MRLTDAQIKKLSDIASEVALISLGSVVLPAVLDRIDAGRMALGFITTILLWATSLWLLKTRG